ALLDFIALGKLAAVLVVPHLVVSVLRRVKAIPVGSPRHRASMILQVLLVFGYRFGRAAEKGALPTELEEAGLHLQHRAAFRRFGDNSVERMQQPGAFAIWRGVDGFGRLIH